VAVTGALMGLGAGITNSIRIKGMEHNDRVSAPINGLKLFLQLSMRLIVTNRGYIGLAVHKAEKGDVIVLSMAARSLWCYGDTEMGSWLLERDIYMALKISNYS
jgi:hypothetical protein